MAFRMKTDRIVLVAASLLCGVALLASSVCSGANTQMVDGVYVLGKVDSLLPARALQNRNVDGVALRVAWDTLEPSPGKFNWSLVDRQIEAAKASGKKVSLTVGAGYRTPQWVYAAGAKRFDFVWGQPWGAPMCSSQSIPIPWDPVFLSRWGDFVRELGRRYDRERTIPLVKITGMNSATEETMLPRFREKAVSRGPYRCRTGDEVSRWKMAGYTRGKVKAAWRSMADVFASAFPDKKLAIITVHLGFPPIDDSGNVIPGSEADSEATRALVAEGEERYGERFIIMNDGLSAFWDPQPGIEAGRRAALGLQMLFPVTNDPLCKMNRRRKPCDPRVVLRSAIDRGLAAGARFMEVYVVDVLNPSLQDVLAYAHRSLTRE